MKKYIIFTILISVFIGFNFNSLFAKESTSQTTNKEVKQLKLNGVEVIGKKEVKLEFGSNIDSNSQKDISVRSSGVDGEENLVKDYKVDGKNVLLTLENELKSNTQYEIIIFSIKGENGSTITSGLDGALKFTTGDLNKFDKKTENSEATGSENKVEKSVEVKSDLKSAGIENKKEVAEKKVEDNPNLAGKEISKKEIDKKIEVVASKKDKLVKTGPEDVLLIVLALILSGLIFYTLRQRKIDQI